MLAQESRLAELVFVLCARVELLVELLVDLQAAQMWCCQLNKVVWWNDTCR